MREERPECTQCPGICLARAERLTSLLVFDTVLLIYAKQACR